MTHTEIIETPVVEALPLSGDRRGKIALTHLNTLLMRFGDPADNYISHTDDEGTTTDTFISNRRFEESVELDFPSFYLPTVELAEWWVKEPIFVVNGMGRAMRPQKPEVDSPNMQIDGENFDWLNSRLQFVKGHPEYTHLETRLIDQAKGTITWERQALTKKQLADAFNNDWPMVIRPFPDLPTVKWHQDQRAIERGEEDGA